MKRKDIISQLLSGHGAAYQRFRGRHVLVAGRRILPLRRGLAGLKDFQRLSCEFGKPPMVLFVPREDVSYILSSRQTPMLGKTFSLNAQENYIFCKIVA